MCSVDEEDLQDGVQTIEEENSLVLGNVLCQKCRVEKASIALNGNNVYCSSCFLVNTTHKFRAALGKSKLVKPSDKILVEHTGSPSCVAMLHLIRTGMHASVRKKLLFNTKVLYIDDGAMEGQSTKSREARVRDIKEQTSALGFELHSVELSCNTKESLKQEHVPNSSPQLELSIGNSDVQNMFAALTDSSAKQDLLQKLRRKLLISSARKLGCNKLFVGDDSSTLAISILSNVALGRGAQVPSHVGAFDTSHGDVILMRPMRDFTRRELDHYLDMHNLKSVVSGESLANSWPQSIQSLTEKFVTDLDSSFRGTVSTVFRTGEKMQASSSSEDRSSEKELCHMCDASLDTDTSDEVISSIQATAFSRLVSLQGPNGNVDLEHVEQLANLPCRTERTSKEYQSGDIANFNKNARPVVVEAEQPTKFLCYGCRLIFKHTNTDDATNWISNTLAQSLTLQNT